MSAVGDNARRARSGRPENPIDEDLPPHRRAFAQRLRDLRNECHAPSYKKLAKRSGRSASRLSDAASGQQLPTWDIASAYVKACLRYSEHPSEEVERIVADWKEVWQRAKDLDNAAPSVNSVSDPASTDFYEVARDGPLIDDVADHRSIDSSAADNADLQPGGQPDSGSLATSDNASADQQNSAAHPSGPTQTRSSSSRTDQITAGRDGGNEATVPSSQRRPILTRRNLLLGLSAAAVGFGGGAIAMRELWHGNSRQATGNSKQPIRVVTSDLWYPEDDYLYAVPGPLSPGQEKRVMEIGHPDEWAWLIRETDAVRFGDTPSPDGPQFSRLEVSLHNVSGEHVLVTKIQASVLHRSAPLAGALAVARAGGEVDVVPIGFDLDNTTDTDARVLDEGFELGPRYTDLKKIALAPEEIVPLRVIAQTKRYYCEWVIEFSVQIAGKIMPVIAPQKGGTFRSTAFADQYATVYEQDVTSWRVRQIPGSKWKWRQ